MTNSNTPLTDSLSKELQLARFNSLRDYRQNLVKASMDFLLAQIRNKVKDAHKDPTYLEMKQEVETISAQLDALANQFHNA